MNPNTPASRSAKAYSTAGADYSVRGSLTPFLFWHLPLFFTGDIPVSDVVYIMTAAVVFAWIVVGSGGSVLLAMLMHASSNAISGEYISPMFTGQDASTLGWIRAGIWVVAATLVIIAAGPGFRRRTDSVG